MIFGHEDSRVLVTGTISVGQMRGRLCRIVGVLEEAMARFEPLELSHR